MKNKETKISYDPDADVLSMEVPGNKKIDYATEAGDFVVHFSKENIPVLVEVLQASRFLKRSRKEVIHASPMLARALA
ncbi:MAG TPA: DUF2283 domain-containing protein [Candidatus Paceibacterota bacterium]